MLTTPNKDVHYKYTRILECLSHTNEDLFIVIASLRQIRNLKNENGEIINQIVQTGPSYSFESTKPFLNLDEQVYELSSEEFGYLQNLYQTNKQEFINYQR